MFDFKLHSPFWRLYDLKDLIILFAVAVLLSFVLTPIAKWLAYKIGAVDVPKDSRRVHKKAMPLMGGLAIFISSVVCILISFGIHRTINSKSVPEFINNLMKFNKNPEIYAILVGGSVLVLLGIVDDCLALGAKIKLLVQIAAATIPVFYGVRVDVISNPFSSTGVTTLPTWFSVVVTIIWIIGVTNAINLIDGLDGLAAGTSCIASIFIGYIAFRNRQFEAFWMAIAVSGACLGFLPFNFNPAKIFMGDTGSTFLGYMLAIISVHGAVKGSATLIVLVPLLTLGLPIFDTAFAIIRRAISGRPIMSADRGHLHHRLIDKGLSQKKAVITMYVINMIFGISAVVAYQSIQIRAIMVIIAPIIIIGVIFMYVKVLSVKSEDESQENESEGNQSGEDENREVISKENIDANKNGNNQEKLVEPKKL